jgi:hypothetical protein
MWQIIPEFRRHNTLTNRLHTKTVIGIVRVYLFISLLKILYNFILPGFIVHDLV